SSPDPCQTYATACSTGLAACVSTGTAADGAPCGSGNICRGGACTPTGYELALQTPAPHALPNQPLSVTLLLRDFSHSPVLTPTTVSVTPPAGAQASADAQTSASDGTVTFTLTPGRAVGLQHFTASAATAFAPLDIPV